MELDELSKGHNGVVKVVVDIKQRKIAAGAKWHSECLKLLEEDGSKFEDCWGCKYNTDSGEIAYKSQINESRKGNKSTEISDSQIREKIENIVMQFIGPDRDIGD